MMLAMMAILLAHEFGHYFAARYHKVAVTLPYFIPYLSFVGGYAGRVYSTAFAFQNKSNYLILA
jgi:hypothetical protein